MRILTCTCALLAGACLPLAVPAVLHAAEKQPSDKVTKGRKTTGAPLLGIKTPGVQIPFDSLKPEAELPQATKPDWVFFSESLYVPNKSSVAKVNAKTNKPGEPIAGTNEPCSGMVSAFNSLWIPSCKDKSLLRLDAKTGKVSATIPAGTSLMAGSIAASSDSVWMLTDTKTTLSRIDPDQNSVVGELRLPAGCRGLIFGETALWIACPNENQVMRINPATNHVEKSIDVAEGPEALIAGDGSIWAYCAKEGKLDRIDPKTNKVIKTIELKVPGAGGSLAFGEGSLWVSQPGYPLTRISTTAEKERVVQQFHGEGGGAITISTGAIWLADSNGPKVLRIDPKRVAATLAE